MRNFKKFLLFLICFQLIFFGCQAPITINKPLFKPFLKHKPISFESLALIHKESSKDIVFADLNQAFALMRNGDIENPQTRDQILSLLTSSVSSFEDLSDPINFSKAFFVDENKPFRGRPHERMFSALMAGIFYMAKGNCDMARPYFKNAEFLDAREQKLPFGTDAPLVYALSLRCLLEKNAAIDDIKRAKDGVFRSVRFLSVQESLINLMIKTKEVDMRPMAISNRMAYMLMEIGLYYSLISAPNDFDVEQLIDVALKNGQIFTSSIKTHFEREYKENLMPLIKEQAKIFGLAQKKGIEMIQDLSFSKVDLELLSISKKMINIYKKYNKLANPIKKDLISTKDLYDKIISAAQGDKMILNFINLGPKLEIKGSYDEISVIIESPTANPHSKIREKNIDTKTSCGFHRKPDEGFSLVLCKPDAKGGDGKAHIIPSLELLSLSQKAKRIAGRKFDEVLKGRAQFKAATENIAEVSAWSAFFLFYMGTSIAQSCQMKRAPESCYMPAYALWIASAITVVFSGTIWLIGKTKNPKADSRYIHLMYESVYVGV